MKRGPLTYKQTLAANRKTMRGHMAATEGIFERKVEIPAALIDEPIPRTLHKRTFAEQKVINAEIRREAVVKKECLAMLYKHPKIVTVGKFNNGGNYFGKQFVRYNQIRGDNHEDIRMVDCECKMVNGGTLAIDFKRSDWTPPDWERLRLKELRDGTKGFLTKSEEKEVAQKRYLDKINALPNGIGIFATDVQTVIDKLEGI